MELQPIETAPMDGTRVLVARCHVDGRPISWVTSAHYNPHYTSQRGVWDTGDPMMGALIQPTHWAPMPVAPPKGASDE